MYISSDILCYCFSFADITPPELHYFYLFLLFIYIYVFQIDEAKSNAEAEVQRVKEAMTQEVERVRKEMTEVSNKNLQDIQTKFDQLKCDVSIRIYYTVRMYFLDFFTRLDFSSLNVVLPSLSDLLSE